MRRRDCSLVVGSVGASVVLAFCWAVWSNDSWAEDNRPAPVSTNAVRILWLGNSYTWGEDLWMKTGDILQEMGVCKESHSVLLASGGKPLASHWGCYVAGWRMGKFDKASTKEWITGDMTNVMPEIQRLAEVEKSRGRQGPKGDILDILACAENPKWNYIVLQPWGGEDNHEDANATTGLEKTIGNFVTDIRKYQPQAKIILFAQSWIKGGKQPDGTQIFVSFFNRKWEESYMEAHAKMYDTWAKKFDVIVVPAFVGTQMGVQEGKGGIQGDGTHPPAACYYMITCMFADAIAGRNCAGTKIRPTTKIPEEDVPYLQDLAWRALAEYVRLVNKKTGQPKP